MKKLTRFTDFTVKQIQQLCAIPSPSGFTAEVREYLRKQFTEMSLPVTESNKGSVIIDLGGKGNPLVLAAHVDTLGAMVRSIKGNGRLRMTQVGGYPFNYIETENCLVHTRTGKVFDGTIMLVNPASHVNRKAGSTERTDETMEVVLDEKVFDKNDVKKLGINAGDFISFNPRTVVTKSGYIKSRHLDDKASAAVLIALAKYILKEKALLTRKVYLLFTTYEEVGHGGSSGIPEDALEMISVDMGAVGDDLETDEHKVSICAKDSSGPYDYDITNSLIKIAKEKKLQYAVDIYPFYGSDVSGTLRAGYDIRHGLIG
ncbi:MAG: M42 family metallopeptidase, partial [Candidatus Cloacimonetes bacterium]|nr:M42 family metallopeptidase [Candidatus Cloacimonadota bacterium]